MTDPTLHRVVALAVAILLAALLSAGAIIAIFPLLRRYALARPNARSSHRAPTPQGAGLAVIGTALLISAVGISFWSQWRPDIVALFVAAILLMAAGALDDLRPLPVFPRFALQALATALVVFMLPATVRLVPWLPIAVERVLLLLGGLWFVNLVNFMDGLDWMTVAEMVPLSAAVTGLSLIGALTPQATIVAVAVLGALFGFAPFNRPVARVFLGDVGSLPLGLLTGWCLIDLAANDGVAAALLLPLYYIADATLTLLRRLRGGEKIWVAHRSHFYQRACDNGFSVIEIVATVFALNVLLASLSFLCVMLPLYLVHTLALVVGAIAVGFVLLRFAAPKSVRFVPPI